MRSVPTRFAAALLATSALLPVAAFAEDAPADPAAPAPALEDQFRDPPQSARPRVWWHWMNGNITKDGIAKDLEWMKRVGIGGLQNFDANLQTPQVVDHRLVYMTPEWKDAFRFAASEADRHGLELAIAASPGWSETGGPWVPVADGLKKVVWSETTIDAGRRFTGTLALPPQVTGPFQSLKPAAGIESMIAGEKEPEKPHAYGDVAVLAFPVPAGKPLPLPKASDAAGKALDAALLSDGDLAAGVKLDQPAAGGDLAAVLDYGAPVTVRSARIYAPGLSMVFLGKLYDVHLEASDDGAAWRAVAETGPSTVPTTISFEPVTARKFRLRFVRTQGAGMKLGAAAPGIAFGDITAGFAGLLKQPLPLGTFELFPEARVDEAETKAGFEVAQDYYAISGKGGPATSVAPGQVIDITSLMKPDGSLDWTPPRLPGGQAWKVVRMGWTLLGTTNHPAPPEATGLEVDKFDGEAVQRYLDHYIGMYRDASGGLIGKRGVQAILTDSIEVGAANWTPKMVAQFKRLRGYDPTPWLPALTGTLVGTREQSDSFLYDYRRTLADLMASEHYGTVARVAHQNGLRVYGEALEDHRPSLGDDMDMRRFADVPMSAMWTHTREDGPRVTYLADVKGAASVAHVYGQNLVAAESMTAFMNPWNYGPADLKRVIDLEFVTGVNRPVIHTSVHVPVDDKKPGLSLFIFGQYFNRQESWAEMAKPWVDYLSRNSLMLQQGRNVADVGYVYGEEAPLTGLYGDKVVADAPKQWAYDFISNHALTNAMVNDGAALVTQGGARYRALYLGGSSSRMTLPTLRRLAKLVEGGATVVGTAPVGNPSLAGDKAEYAALVAKLWPGTPVAQIGQGRVIASTDIEAAMAQIGVAPDFRFTGGGEGAEIPFVHRQLADGESWFLVNRQGRAETIEARFRVTGKAPEIWRAETGKSEAVSYRIENGETVVPLTLRPDDALHVVFRKPAAADALAIKQLEPVTLATLSAPWAVSFQEGRGAPAAGTTMASLAPLNENAEPGIRYFSGEAIYTTRFTAPKGWKPGQPLWLDLGEAREVAEVTVNGKSAGMVWHAPYRVDVSTLARKGSNTLAVKVANLWVNRLVGDAQPGAAKVTWTALPTYKADAPLRRSGLIGPVTLVGQQTAGR